MSRHSFTAIGIFFRRAAQTCRSMVGVGDYPAYRAHMERQHPQLTPMTEQEYVRHCQDARFPSRPGKIPRCPC